MRAALELPASTGDGYPDNGKTRVCLHCPVVTMLQTADRQTQFNVFCKYSGYWPRCGAAEPGPDDGPPARTPPPATAAAFHFLKLVNKIFYIKIIHSAELVCSTVGAGRWLNTVQQQEEGCKMKIKIFNNGSHSTQLK